MTQKPIIFVAGLGRCGTSLLMQMLDAAGIRCAGEYPAFEPSEMGSYLEPVDTEWLLAHAGGAVKWINPHKVIVNEGVTNAIVIWMCRDKRQQAKSQAKFISATEGVSFDRPQVSRLKTQLRKETAAALVSISRFAGHSVRFDELLKTPLVEATKLVAFLSKHGFIFSDQSAQVMAKQVLRRAPACMPDFSIETKLISAHGGTHR